MLTVGFHELFNINCTLCSLSCSLLMSLLHLRPRSHQHAHWEDGEQHGSGTKSILCHFYLLCSALESCQDFNRNFINLQAESIIYGVN